MVDEYHDANPLRSYMRNAQLSVTTAEAGL